MAAGDSAKMTNHHEVELDGAGWPGWPRLTCCTCNGETLLRAPYMTSRQWRARVTKFAEDHPSRTTADYASSLESQLAPEDDSKFESIPLKEEDDEFD